MIFSINVSGFITSLTVMLKGMLGIFCVIALIWLFIAALNRLTSSKAPKE